MRTSSRAVRVAAVVTLAAMAGCGGATVRVSFRPPAGARYAYQVQVRSESVVELDGRPAQRRGDDVVFRAEHEVLDAGPGGSRVHVNLTDVERGGPEGTRTFVVRLDRAAQLVKVERVEGVPSEVLGELGLSEIFPEAAGAAPDRAVAPGERWTVDEPVEMPGAERTRLQGRGRVAELGVENGREVAVVDVRTTLPVHRRSTSANGTVELRGTQTTTTTAVHALADGAVERARSHTRGEYRLEVRPPAGEDVRPVVGRIVVEVRSSTRRTDRPASERHERETKEGRR